MIILKSRDEIEKMRRANQIVAEILQRLSAEAKPGVTTKELDSMAYEWTLEKGAKPAFLGYSGYPASLCTSINEEVVHGIPSSERVLREGDILGMDFGVIVDGFCGDSAVTVAIGRVSDEAQRLMRVTRDALYKGIEQAKPGNRLYDIGAAIQEHVEGFNFSVVRDFVGHGIGRKMHEPPQVPNFGKWGTGVRIQAGMTMAIEPMINAGDYKVRVLEDNWTAVTADGSLSAHFEHSIAVTEDGAIILSGWN